MNKIVRSYGYILLAMVAGVVSGLLNIEGVFKAADTLATLFMNFLQMITAPIVFLSIFSTLLGMSGFKEMKLLGKKVITYTILTTLIAATVALALFVIFDPAKHTSLIKEGWSASPGHQGSYLSFFVNIVPSNMVQVFLENNVIAIAFLSFLLGLAAFKLPVENRQILDRFFSSFFKLILKVAEMVIVIMPIGIWAFVTLLVKEMQQSSGQFNSLIIYLGVVLGANLLQGLIVLPLLLKAKGLSPYRIAKGASKALILAFCSKSSNATLPITLECAQDRLGIRAKIANFSLPLCTVINMNGCAAFILTTVLFVSNMHGIVFSPLELGLWVILASIAAIGNAGVPMGCFFLSSAFLLAMNVPLSLLGAILPFYAFLDMVETALNVWSDIVVTAIIDKELKEEVAVCG